MMTPKFGCAALRYTCRIPSRRKSLISPVASRLQSFHTSTIYRSDSPDHPDHPEPPKPNVFKVSSLNPQARDHYNTLSPQQRAEYEEAVKKVHEHMTSPAVESNLHDNVAHELREFAKEEPRVDIKFPRIKEGFFATGEDESQEIGEDEEFEGDDITSIAHGELEQHREIREYMRIAAWEMPMLSSLFSIPLSLKDHEELIGS